MISRFLTNYLIQKYASHFSALVEKNDGLIKLMRVIVRSLNQDREEFDLQDHYQRKTYQTISEIRDLLNSSFHLESAVVKMVKFSDDLKEKFNNDDFMVKVDYVLSQSGDEAGDIVSSFMSGELHDNIFGNLKHVFKWLNDPNAMHNHFNLIEFAKTAEHELQKYLYLMSIFDSLLEND